jgi:tetratricopeptide (TPR) repeat protein
VYKKLRAAQGFLELGDPDSAWEELELISAEDRAHPIVLRMRTYIYRDKGKWMEMAEIARHLTQIETQEPEHWTNRAWAERRHMGLQTAEETLLLARELFPKEPLIHYNLACYTAQLGRIDDAKALLATALTLDPVFKEMALEDEDLAGVW